jgi:hypothetical protein
VLDESEPFYEDGAFRVELPPEPTGRLTAVVVDDEKLERTLEIYVDEIESELYDVFGVERPESA